MVLVLVSYAMSLVLSYASSQQFSSVGQVYTVICVDGLI